MLKIIKIVTGWQTFGTDILFQDKGIPVCN